MSFNFFSKNGQVLPVTDAVVSISSVEYAYGFGVYETLRVSGGQLYFLQDHLERLIDSAQIIGLEHTFDIQNITRYFNELIIANKVDTCNVKMLLIGAPKKEDAQLYIICLNPLFPDRKLYRDGAKLVTYNYERVFPHAKTLNMLVSYLAYKKARENDAYDSLLINKAGFITEGTRTNFYCLKDKTIYSPKEKDILIGVTRKAILKVAKENGYDLVEQDISLSDLKNYDSVFISSTSTKIMPISSVDDIQLNKASESLVRLMELFSDFLSNCKGEL